MPPHDLHKIHSRRVKDLNIASKIDYAKWNHKSSRRKYRIIFIKHHSQEFLSDTKPIRSWQKQKIADCKNINKKAVTGKIFYICDTPQR